MKELVEVIAKALVDNPDEVEVVEKENGNTLVLELHVAGSDMGKVMGYITPKVKGKADLSSISKVVKERLSNLWLKRKKMEFF